MADKVKITGLDEILLCIQEQDAMLAKYERFAEDVLLSCVMPEVPRYMLADGEDGSLADQAHDALQKLLVRYRKIVSWLKANKIDPEAIVGEDVGIKS